jgi:hypothetical protein
MDAMMTVATRLLGLVLIGLLAAACTGTKTSESWSDQSFTGKIKNVYIIGIAKSELNRMLFEDTFKKRLTGEGVKVISSYTDLLSTNEKVEREDIKQRLITNNCDSVLLTRVISQRRKSGMSGGRGSYTYTPGPGYPRGLSAQRLPSGTPEGQYGTWYKYYNNGSMNYVAPSSASSVILTVESVLYDLKTEELIWSAQLETHLEGNFENMVQLFVNEVAKDLKGKGLI